MDDSRLADLRKAAERMADGQYPHEVPTEGDDDVAALGRAMLELSLRLERRFREVCCCPASHRR
jgi:hypothetical protein